MNIGEIVAEFFEVSEQKGWTSFHHPLARSRFGTSRAGKFYESGRVLFTFGATAQGKAEGIGQRLADLILGEGLPAVYESSTAGQRRNSSTYVGFESSLTDERHVMALLSGAAKLIARSAPNE